MARLRAGNNTTPRRSGGQSRVDHPCGRFYPYNASTRTNQHVQCNVQQAVRFEPRFSDFEEIQVQPQPQPLQTDGPASPDSTFSVLSLDDASTSGSLTSVTAELDRQRLFSPPIGTPTSSEASSGFYDYPYQYEQERYVGPPHPEYPIWPTFGGGQHCPSPVDYRFPQLAGIAQTASYDDAARYIQPRVEFVSPNGPSPVSHQRYPRTQEPWSGHPLRHEDPMVLDQNMDPVVPVTSPTSSSGEKGGKRVGPLTQRQRTKANAVRIKGACLRCSYMKETCDDCEAGCANCQFKRGRKWKLGCVRRKLSEQIDFLFPAILRQRYSAESVNRYINDNAWWYLDRRHFVLKLDLFLPGPPLQLPVKEVDVLDSRYQDLHAWKTRNEGGIPVMQKTSVWTPPLVLYLTDKPEDKRRIRGQIAQCMNSVFAIKEGDPCIKKGRVYWPWPCFDSDDNDWEAYVVETIFKYWDKDLASHAILGKAHTLLFFHYILDHMCMVTEDALAEMLSNLHNTQGFHPSKSVSPDTVNSFLKSLVFDWVLEMTRSVLKELQDLLHAMALGKDTSTAQSDMAFCLSFLMLVMLGQTQSRLLLLTSYDRREIGIDLPPQEAERLIFEMEKEVGTYIIHFHEFALKRRKQVATSPSSNDAAERHAASFGLMQKIEELTLHQFKAHRPKRFKLPQREIGTFDVINTHRLCWKFVEALGIDAQG